MITAAQLLVFDQTLSEVSAVERLAVRLDKFRDAASSVIKIGRLASAVVRIWVPSSFTTTGDAWDAAERIEPHFFKLYSSVRAVTPPRTHTPVDPSSVLGDDLGLRLIYMRRLVSDLVENRTGPERNLWRKRQREQRVLDDLSVPPDVRLALWKARSLPVLLLMYTFERAGGHVYPVVQQAVREGIDSMIAFALGMHTQVGKHPVAAPSGLGSDIPEPMDIQGVTDRWRVVQVAWSS